MLNYLSSTVSVGNSVFGLSNVVTAALWGTTFIGERFALTLVASGGSVYWKKIDTYMDSTVAYDMTFTPAEAGITAADTHEASTGQFIAADSTYLYYLKANTVVRTALATGLASGSVTLRSSSMAAIPANALGAITVKGSYLYVASKSQGLLYAFNMGAWAWDGTNKDAIRQVAVTELSTYSLSGLFTQPGSDTDVVVLVKQGTNSALAIKYTADLLTRKGDTNWTNPSENIRSAQFRGSILYVAQNDPSVAGTGVLLHRFGDGSTNIVAKEKTQLILSEDRVRAGSGSKVKITFIAKDGYGLTFPITEKVRFSIVRVGDSFDKNDGALALTENGPFRDASDNPVNVSLDASFDVTGKAECYWHAPIEIPVEVLMYRIKVQFPIFS